MEPAGLVGGDLGELAVRNGDGEPQAGGIVEGGAVRRGTGVRASDAGDLGEPAVRDGDEEPQAGGIVERGAVRRGTGVRASDAGEMTNRNAPGHAAKIADTEEMSGAINAGESIKAKAADHDAKASDSEKLLPRASDTGEASKGIELGHDAKVCSVWRQNWEESLQSINCFLNRPGTITIAIDTEYATKCLHRFGQPRNGDEWYSQLQATAGTADLVQVGVALTFAGADADAGSIDPVSVWEFNIFFDSKANQYNPNTLIFLEKKCLHNLEMHREHGIVPSDFFKWVSSVLLSVFARPSVTVVTYQGDADVALLMYEAAPMPAWRLDFLLDVTSTFPSLVDTRVLAILWNPGFFGTLDDLARMLGLSRSGTSHHAGSDAWLTLRCYFTLRSLLGDQELLRARGVLCGLFQSEPSVSAARPAWDPSISILHVSAKNFDEIACQFGRFIGNNFTLVTLKVLFDPPLRRGPFSRDRQFCYSDMQLRIGEQRSCTIAMVFATGQGQVANATSFVFHISFSGSQFIHPTQFARMLHEQRVLRNPYLTWLTFIGAESVAFIYDMVCHTFQLWIPNRFSKYKVSRTDMFRTMYDLGTAVSGGGFRNLREIAASLMIEQPEGVGIGWEAVLTLRSFLRLLMDPRISLRFPGNLLASCCCRSMCFR